MTTRTDLHIPFTTLMKVALFLLLVLITMRLKAVFIMFITASLLAVVLAPIAGWLEKHGVRRAFAVALIGLVVFALLAVFLFVVIPQTASQITEVVNDLPRIMQQVQKKFPGGTPYIQSLLSQLKKPPQPQQVRQWVTGLMTAGKYAINGVWAVVFTVVVALYLLMEGKRLLAWLVSFFPDRQRKKLARTIDEVEPIALAYMRGQLITSTLSFIVSLTALTMLKVPGALPLAVLAFLGDFVPVVGFIAALVPAVLLALTKGAGTALIVLAVYVTYQSIENYIIAPRVYGRQMELSTLTVLLSVTVGGILLGPIGAILLLPAAAAYPTIERIWLREKLPDDTVAKHEAIKEGEGERVANEVLK